MAQIGIQRLGTGHTQNHRAQNDEGGARVIEHEPQRVMRTDRPQNGRVRHDMAHPQHPQHHKPQQGDRAKKLADARRAAFLHGKQHEQDHQRDRDHILLEVGRHDHHALHRRQHRDGRGDDPVAIKQAGAKNAQQQKHLAQLRPVFDRLGCQRQHGDQATFAVVVGTQHQHHVLEGDDNRQGPEEDREDAVDVFGCERHMARAKHLLDRVQNTGTDVAVDDTDGAQRECGQGRFGCGHKKQRDMVMSAPFGCLEDRHCAPPPCRCKRGRALKHAKTG